ncbi:MAG: hypothetical protein AUK35_10320 [Zetaproteobacteria bacterium CG2_30_46_52]|nr:MAG: hypothetical protein AUK35_10320 [Zetaproteobacteria bacterium CG2_30_46_52]
MLRLAICLGCCLSLVACQLHSKADTKETHFLLGTIVDFTVYSDNQEIAAVAITDAAAQMRQVEAMFTTYGETKNTVKTFNAAQVFTPVQLDAPVDALLQQSLSLMQNYQGSFDPALGQLSLAWGFSTGEAHLHALPSAQVQALLDKSGGVFVQRVGKGLWQKTKPGVWLDFGAIAKGYAIDMGIQTLQKHGVTSAIINAGGDMRIMGSHGKNPWKIAIRHPRKVTSLGWLEVRGDNSIVTSGDYERFFIEDGQRYHHILDPKTGYPSSASMSVTVLAPTATLADAVSTAMFVWGPKKGLPTIENTAGLEALWLDANAKLVISSGLVPIFHAL